MADAKKLRAYRRALERALRSAEHSATTSGRSYRRLRDLVAEADALAADIGTEALKVHVRSSASAALDAASEVTNKTYSLATRMRELAQLAGVELVRRRR